MDIKDSRYIKKHLKEYILFQISQGYDAKDIKQILADYGYDKDKLEKIFSEIGHIKPKIQQKHTNKKMSHDLQDYLIVLIANFMVKEMEQGYSQEQVRKALINYGHDPAMIDAAISRLAGKNHDKLDVDDMLQGSKQHKSAKKSNEGAFPLSFLYAISIILLTVMVFVLAMLTLTSLNLIFISFFPSYIGMTLVYFSLAHLKVKEYIGMIPFIAVMVTVLLFAVMFIFQTKVLEMSEPGTVALLNALAVFILSSLLCWTGKLPRLDEDATPEGIVHKEQKEPEPDIKLADELDKETDKLEKMLQKEFPEKRGQKDRDSE